MQLATVNEAMISMTRTVSLLGGMAGLGLRILATCSQDTLL